MANIFSGIFADICPSCYAIDDGILRVDDLITINPDIHPASLTNLLGSVAKIGSAGPNCGCPPRTLIAIVVAESSNNEAEAAAITSVILKRIILNRQRAYPSYDKNTTCPLDDAFLNQGSYLKYSSKKVNQFWITFFRTVYTWPDFIGGTPVMNGYEPKNPNSKYSIALKMSEAELCQKYGPIVKGLTQAYQNYLQDYSSEAWFWASSNRTLSTSLQGPWANYDKGICIITKALGGTTFFRYKNIKRTWP